MKNIIITFVCSIFMTLSVFSQKEVDEYSFVVVPDTYSFLMENDQYQVNSLTKFLFNKYGFNAFFNHELPQVGRCDGLWADVEIDPGFIWTKMVVVLKDCNGAEVFRSFEGRSKQKVYKKAYHEALRGAFESIAALGIKQPEPAIFGDTKVANTALDSTDDISVSKISEEKKNGIVVKEAEVTIENLSGISSNYVSNGAPFLLTTTDDGHALYEGSASTGLKLKGNLRLTNDKRLEFTDLTGNIFNASFDSEKTLTIETGFQKVRFTLVR